MKETAITMAAAFLAACSPQAGTDPAAAATETQDAASTHPVSGLEVVPLTVTSGDTVHRFRAEVAASAEEQSRGLMFRTRIGPDEAMIFPRKDLRPARFWMKNTPIPLDIIFIGPDGRIANIAAMTVPYSLDGVESDGVVSAVLEIAGGRAAELGLAAGDKVEW